MGVIVARSRAGAASWLLGVAHAVDCARGHGVDAPLQSCLQPERPLRGAVGCHIRLVSAAADLAEAALRAQPLAALSDAPADRQRLARHAAAALAAAGVVGEATKADATTIETRRLARDRRDRRDRVVATCLDAKHLAVAS